MILLKKKKNISPCDDRYHTEVTQLRCEVRYLC